MARRVSQDSEDKVADLTPMLDVVFIMLIFFIVTASFIKETGVEIDRPDTETAELKKILKPGQQVDVFTLSNEPVEIEGTPADNLFWVE